MTTQVFHNGPILTERGFETDVCVVVEDGQIVERGSHSDLLEHRGVYAQLHKMQFGA